MMDDDFISQLPEVMEQIKTAEAVSVFFPTFGKALVVDARSNQEQGPMIRIMPMVVSPQERLRSIGRLRPGFPRLQTLTLLPWSRYVDSLVTLGLWGQIVERLETAGLGDATVACDSVLEELRRLEREELVRMVRGENCQTIWSARG